MTLTDDEFKDLEKHYPDRIQEILRKHIIAGKKMVRDEVRRIRQKGEVPESG